MGNETNKTTVAYRGAAIVFLVLATCLLACALPHRAFAVELTTANAAGKASPVDRIEDAFKKHDEWVYFSDSEGVDSGKVIYYYLQAVARDTRYLLEVATDKKTVYVYSGTHHVSALKVAYNSGGQKKVIKKTVKGMVGKLSPKMGSVQKYKSLHDSLVRRCSYKSGSYSISGALGTGRQGNCFAYALSYVLLCKSAGLKAAYLGSPNDPMSHGWCAVKVKGKWYEVDPTWNDPEKGKSKKVSYRYFMRGRSYMKKLDYHHKLAVYAPAKVKLSKVDYKMKRQRLM